MTPWQAVLFDLDDTLYPERTFVDSGFRAVGHFLAPHIGRSAQSIAGRLRALHDRDGRGLLFDTLLMEAEKGGERDLAIAALMIYRTHRPRIRPFPAVVDTIDAIKAAGIAIGLVSDGLASVQYRKVAALRGITQRLDVIVMTDELGPGNAKPSPAPFRVACTALGVEAARTVYVANDPRKDFEGARAAGLATVRTGLFPDEGPAGSIKPDRAIDADVVLDEFSAIQTVLFSEAPWPDALAEATR